MPNIMIDDETFLERVRDSFTPAEIVSWLEEADEIEMDDIIDALDFILLSCKRELMEEME